MANEKIRLDFVPDKRILRTISKTGSSFKDSFSEMIDNSLDSFKSAEDRLKTDFVTISIQFITPGQEGIFRYKNKKNEDYDIEIWDDASGMSEKEFKKCLKLAYVDEKKIKKGSIRRYGVGLKTSLLSLGKKFKIMTRPIGSKKIFSLTYDDDEFVNSQDMDWNSIFFTVEEDDPEFPKHGTIIKIKKRDDLRIYPVKISQMKSYFRIQYSQFLKEELGSKKELKLIINKHEVESYPLELITFRGKKKHEFCFKLSSGKEVKGWYGFYEKGSKRGQVKGNFGFDLIWQRRIIERYSKVGIRTHPEYQRIYGEIHLDELDVDFHKTSFIKDNKDYVDFELNLDYMLKGPDYEQAKEYFSSNVEETKTLIQLNVEVKQFNTLFDFLDSVQKSRKLRMQIKKIIWNLEELDILPIPSEQLRDLEIKLNYERIPLENLKEHEKIIDKVEKDLIKQREEREKSKEKKKEAKQEEKAEEDAKLKDLEEIRFLIDKENKSIQINADFFQEPMMITPHHKFYAKIISLIDEIKIKKN